MRIAQPATAGMILAASVASTPAPVDGPAMPPQVVTFAPVGPGADAHEVTVQYDAGFQAVRGLSPQSPLLNGSQGQDRWAEAMASEIQGAMRTASSVLKHPAGRRFGIPVVAGIFGGLVLREAGAHWGNETLERIGRSLGDVGDFAAGLLGHDGRVIDGVTGGIVVTAHLCDFALPDHAGAFDNLANSAKLVDGLAAHRDEITQAIAQGALLLSPIDPHVIPEL